MHACMRTDLMLDACLVRVNAKYRTPLWIRVDMGLVMALVNACHEHRVTLLYT